MHTFRLQKPHRSFKTRNIVLNLQKSRTVLSNQGDILLKFLLKYLKIYFSNRMKPWNSVCLEEKGFKDITHMVIYSFTYLSNLSQEENVTANLSVFRTQSMIWDGTSCKTSWRLKVVNYFRKTLPLRCLAGIWRFCCGITINYFTREVRS